MLLLSACVYTHATSFREKGNSIYVCVCVPTQWECESYEACTTCCIIIYCMCCIGSLQKLLLLDYACLARSMRDRLRFTIFYAHTHPPALSLSNKQTHWIESTTCSINRFEIYLCLLFISITHEKTREINKDRKKRAKGDRDRKREILQKKIKSFQEKACSSCG